jgi:hypothetical protein
MDNLKCVWIWIWIAKNCPYIHMDGYGLGRLALLTRRIEAFEEMPRTHSSFITTSGHSHCGAGLQIFSVTFEAVR